MKYNREIVLNSKEVTYELEFKKIKKVHISIKPKKVVYVSAPYGTSIELIEKFLQEHSDFILNSIEWQKIIAENMPEPKKYQNGEYIYFLGEKKNLYVVQSDRNSAVLKGDSIYLYVTDSDNFALKEHTMDDFIKAECQKLVTGMCRELYPRFKAKGIAFPKEIRFRKMVSCWGNCRPERGILTFNTHLIQLPQKSIEAVICHEFTHFLHGNHSKAFYNQLTEFMPDWRIHDKIMRIYKTR